MKKKYVMRIGLSLLGICLSTVFMWIMWRCLPNFYLICLSTNIENVVQVEFEIDEGWKLSVAGDNEMEPVKFLIDDPDTAKTFSEKMVKWMQQTLPARDIWGVSQTIALHIYERVPYVVTYRNGQIQKGIVYIELPKYWLIGEPTPLEQALRDVLPYRVSD